MNRLTTKSRALITMKGFTLIEVLIAVLVLAFALGASLQAIGNYTTFQVALEQRYRTHLIAWNAFMECYVQVRTEEADVCETSGFVRQNDGYWDWQAEEQEGELVLDLAHEEEIRLPLTIRTVQVLSADDEQHVVSELTSILINRHAPDSGFESNADSDSGFEDQ